MSRPQVIESIKIGKIAGSDAHAWIERMDGALRYFKDVPDSVFCQSLGRELGLSSVVEIEAREYHLLFSVFAAGN